MGRPKGSTNKQKKEAAAKVEAELNAINIIETNPTPIKSEPKSGSCAECIHPKETHYGPKTDWCNTPNCRCSSWK